MDPASVTAKYVEGTRRQGRPSLIFLSFISSVRSSNSHPNPQPHTQLTTSPQTNSPNKSPQGPGRKLCAPAANVGGNSIFNQLGTPTMLQSSHLTSKPAQPPANTSGNNATVQRA